MKIYCYTCGKPIGYTTEKPKFCQRCGSELNSASSKESSPIKEKEPLETQVEQQPDHTEAQGLEVEISHTEQKVLNFGNIMGTSTGGESLDENKPKRVNKKQFWEDFQKEAGQLRKR